MKDMIKNIVFYAVVAILLLYVTLQVVAPRFTLAIFRFTPYVVVTESMEPVINVNDLVIVKNYDLDELEVDDIITFEADVDYDGEKDVVTHYIHSITENNGEYIIRTHRYFDNQDDYFADPWVIDQDDILGLYNFHIPWVGTIVRFIQSPFGIAAILVNIGVIIGVVYIIKSKPEEQTKDSESDQ